VGEMIFDDPNYPGDCHIKYGFIKGDKYYAIKIAQGFYNNPKLGLPSINGLNILFNQKNGIIECILLDEGYLTNIRTACAGAIAAKYMAPETVNRIGIFGTGIQGKLQLRYLKYVTNCRKVTIWGRSEESLNKYREEMVDSGFDIQTTLNVEDITNTCNLIVTCTPSKDPLIKVNQIQKGTHITALGSDTPEKQELDSEILHKADRVISDSISQAESRGECYHAMKNGKITKEELIELGTMISNKKYQRSSNDEITVVDLTGVAVQDIQISKAVYEGYLSNKS
ncbi:MAG: ornithine cyclodeaminase family protein, partial [Candidatus Hodarchaeales archaeon]